MWLFVFFKQKTAYEMRISDWSSDVCSSDLAGGSFLPRSPEDFSHAYDLPRCGARRRGGRSSQLGRASFPAPARCRSGASASARGGPPLFHGPAARGDGTRLWRERCCRRSEEHTSELQSLMRISYAVFCLKKKTQSEKDTTSS